jgi:hypothetical protein
MSNVLVRLVSRVKYWTLFNDWFGQLSINTPGAIWSFYIEYLRRRSLQANLDRRSSEDVAPSKDFKHLGLPCARKARRMREDPRVGYGERSNR